MDLSYKEVFNNTTQFRGVLAPDGTLCAVNDAMLEFTGSEREEVIGTKLWNVPGIFPERSQHQIRADVERAADGEFVRHEMRIQGAERTTLIDFSLHPLTDEADEVTYLLAGGYDLTALNHQVTESSQTPHGQPHTNLLVMYSLDENEAMSEAILQAFFAVDTDPFEKDRTLEDVIDTDLLDGFDWHASRPLSIETRIWGYFVELTGEEVRIYTDFRS